MTTRFKQPGATLTLTAPYARATSGLGMLVGAIFAVTLQAIENGARGECATEGVHDLDKTEAQAWVEGDRLFWNVATKLVDNDPTVGPFIGVATAAAANPSSTGSVKLVPPSAADEGTQPAIADLTDNTGAAANDSTLAAGVPAAVAAYAAVVNLTDPVTKAEGEAISAALAALRDSVEAQRAILVVHNQNLSDLAAKLNTLLATERVVGTIAA